MVGHGDSSDVVEAVRQGPVRLVYGLLGCRSYGLHTSPQDRAYGRGHQGAGHEHHVSRGVVPSQREQ